MSDTEEKRFCGDCVAFHTHFCPFYDFGNVVQEADLACADFWPLEKRIGKLGKKEPSKQIVEVARIE